MGYGAFRALEVVGACQGREGRSSRTPGAPCGRFPGDPGRNLRRESPAVAAGPRESQVFPLGGGRSRAYLRNMSLSRPLRRAVRALVPLLVSGVAAAGEPPTVLLIPDSFRENIWAFSPVDGALISNDYVPDNGLMSQAICAIGSPSGTILVSDELLDRVIEITPTGQLIRIVIGPKDGLDGPFGIEVRDGAVYVCSRVQQRIWKVVLATREISIWWDATGIAGPRDIVFRANDAIVTDSDGDDLERVSLDGQWLGTWVDSDGVSQFDFPQQLQRLAMGDILVANFSDPRGLWRYDGEFAFLNGVASPTFTSPRGVYELETGEWLYAGGTRVMAVNPKTYIERTIVNDLGASFRFIEPFTPSPLAPCPADLDGDRVVGGADLATLLGAWGTPAADLDGSGTTDAADLSIVLGAWGACP